MNTASNRPTTVVRSGTASVDDGVKKAKLLLERAQERSEAARKYGLVAPTSIGHVTVAEGIEKFIQRKIMAGKRPGTVTAYKFTLGLFKFVKKIEAA